MIDRPEYINAVKPFMGKPLVKILAGIRRSGKSTIFEMLKAEMLKRKIPEDAIIHKRYTEMDIPQNITAKQMFEELKAAMEGKDHCVLLLDEIQEVRDWEKAVNPLLEGTDADIYVTGSNSKLMSSEISTYLTGRYILIPVYPLSFKEYLTFKNKSTLSQNELLEEYIRFGGFPIVALGDYEASSAYQIVEDIYHTSANSISQFLKSEHRKVSVESIYNYIRWLEQAFIIYPCQRYDLQGKSVLKTQEKYYLADCSLKYALLGYNRKMLDGVLENIVFLELKRRGYDVFVGKNGTKEIDFIALRRDEKIYVQVCVQLPENSDHEIDNLMEIRDHYPKFVVTMNPLDTGIENGIRIVHLKDFFIEDIK